MGKWIGRLCILLGVFCLLGALGLVLRNRWEAKKAGETSRNMVESVGNSILANREGAFSQSETDNPDETVGTVAEMQETVPAEMPTVEVDGEKCIGILSIPALGLELPVLTDWSYEKLKKAPCLYYGSYYEPNFVIAAHNYASHFGRLSQLRPGDLVTFTDVNGSVYSYEVALLETLPKEATEAMITGGFDLSLYTCTTGGGSRVTVRCIGQ